MPTLQTVRGEQAILLANSQAGHLAPLYDLIRPGQWALLVVTGGGIRCNQPCWLHLTLPPMTNSWDLTVSHSYSHLSLMFDRFNAYFKCFHV